MPTQRTLLMTIAGLFVTLAFLIGYISGYKSGPQGTIEAQNDKGQQSQSAQKPLRDMVKKPAGSSYDSVYADDKGQVYHDDSNEDAVSFSDRSAIKVRKKAKFIFLPQEKSKIAYGWRKKPQTGHLIGEGYQTGQQIEQGDGHYILKQPGSRTMQIPPRGAGVYYYPSTQPVPQYGVPAPVIQNPYGSYFPPSSGYYVPYRR